MASNVLHTSSHLDSFLFSHLPLKFFFLTMRHLQWQESQAFRQMTDYPQNGSIAFGGIPKNRLPFPKSGNPQKRQDRHFLFGKKESPFYRHSQKQIPRNQLPKMVLGRFSMSRGNPDYPLKAIPHILCPFLPKTIQKHDTSETCHSDSNRTRI